ncbi:hypothetical protein T01_551 [Trichinella spiralis]|uniref:Uncharacterized protein n=1 Tax=Trichinella spiralis TaxID=6334 RepID=A0A0V1BGS6_TRISP|nr:hypothetical protein T01_551 [Trichinella spiralis]
MSSRRRDRECEKDQAQTSDGGRTGANPEADQPTPPGGSLQCYQPGTWSTIILLFNALAFPTGSNVSQRIITLVVKAYVNVADHISDAVALVESGTLIMISLQFPFAIHTAFHGFFKEFQSLTYQDSSGEGTGMVEKTSGEQATILDPDSEIQLQVSTWIGRKNTAPGFALRLRPRANKNLHIPSGYASGVLLHHICPQGRFMQIFNPLRPQALPSGYAPGQIKICIFSPGYAHG